MAKLLGCSYAYVAMIESGINPKTGKKISPSIEIFKKMADLLFISLDDLLKMLDGKQPISFKSIDVAEEIQNNGGKLPLPPFLSSSANGGLSDGIIKIIDKLSGLSEDKYVEVEKYIDYLNYKNNK